MSVEAPERIWITREDMGQSWPGAYKVFRASDLEHPDCPEYVLADKMEELAAALRIAQGNTDAAIEDYNEAQAALAAAKREIEALREALEVLTANIVHAFPSLANLGPVKNAQQVLSLTAAEQAEPAPSPDDSLSAVISSIGNEIHNLACERQNDEDLSERLSDFRDRLWAIAQQAPIEPAPAARSGAVKVKQLEWEHGKGSLVGQEVWSSGDPWTFWIVRNPSYNQNYVWCENLGFADNVPASPVRGSFDTLEEAKAAAQADYELRILAALEPAELATDAEPVAHIKRDGNKVGIMPTEEMYRLPDGEPLYTHPPESRLREALVQIANNTCCDGCQEAALVARAALAQGADDERA